MYSRIPVPVRTWIQEIADEWNFNKIVPCHFDAPIACGPRDLVAAFERSSAVYGSEASFDASLSVDNASADARAGSNWLLQRLLDLRRAGSKPGENVIDPGDLKALDNINWFLEKSGAIVKRSEVER